MAAVLDKARELSRNEPSADWSEAEWKELMAAAVSQKIERKAGRARSRTAGPYHWKPALAYGTVALIMVAVMGYHPQEYDIQVCGGPFGPSHGPRFKSQSPPPLPAIASPAVRHSLGHRPSPAKDRRREARPAPSPDARQARVPEPPPPAARREPPRTSVTVKLVSPDTGLQIVWVLNRNFELERRKRMKKDNCRSPLRSSS